MSRMSELHLEISEDLEENLLTFEQIAAKYSIPFEWVEAVWRSYGYSSLSKFSS